ncbi:MAG: ABC-F family ATP-binding cassette domain-containing protein [Candidatus Eremiobacteraeota bacterium]|nr:ABC-F family ATP-binding cassette domain-containing protein [Candidatus Eremiobacteraeota bacterium]
MEWIRFDGLERAYGARTIFEGVSGVVRDGAKIGLVGPNGAGKSSLVRILADLERPDGGTIARAKDGRLGYLSQAVSGDTAATLREILERAFAQMRGEEARVRDLEERLTAASEVDDARAVERLLQEYGDAREAFDRHGGEGLERRMRSMLASFGFVDGDLDRPASAFSGGQRTRAALARMLLEEPDYLILDEPTNHLDIETVRWLEEFLRDDPRAALVVSHDRYFLDRVANEVWELDGGELTHYDEMPQGRAYSAYVAEKALRRELAQRDYERFVDEEKRRKAVVAELRTHGSHNYSHVRSREKQLAKMERVEAPKTSQQTISVKLAAARRATTGLALRAVDLAAAYDTTLFEHLTFSVTRGERIAVVGPNGAGKSTLLAILSGRRSPDRGAVTVQDGIRTAYFSQDAADELPAGMSAVDAVLLGATILPEEGRALLGRLGLGGDAGDKPVEAFSGGERRRIMLARLMARSADCLFLDEPTNDLDIPSREGLEDVLASYGGAMVVVSHDRYLLQRLAEKVLWIRGGAATLVDGGYERFEELQRPPISEPPPKQKPKPAQAAEPAPRRDERAKRGSERDLAAAEREVARLDEERVLLEREFADPGLYDDRERVATLEARLADNGRASEAAFERWERLSTLAAAVP